MQIFFNYLIIGLLILGSLNGSSQEELPISFTGIDPDEIPVYELSDEIIRLHADTPAIREKVFQIGIPVPVSIQLNRLGRWFHMADGRSACLLKIKSGNATHLNLILSGMPLDRKSAVYAYGPGGINLHTIQTLSDQKGASIPVTGDELILEYNGPAGTEPDIAIDWIVHGYRNFRKALRDFGESGACNINVNCPEWIDWEQQASGVVMLLTANNSRFCSGAMINNTSYDGTPYLLTAAHCDPAPTDLFMFNYQSSSCFDTDGPVDQIVQGCTVRSKNPGSDFCLVELNPPTQSIQSYLCGWDKSTDEPNQTTVIHHPEGDIKKISRDADPPMTNAYLGAICWHVLGYESGTTESGSSGAPLFNAQKRIVGQLFGGDADCNFNFDDYYGKFSASWDGNSFNERLRDWLDPKLVKPGAIDGMPQTFFRPVHDARLVVIRNLPDVICGEQTVMPRLEIKNMGTSEIQSLEVQYRYGQSLPASMMLNSTLAPLATVQIELPPPQGDGEQELACWIKQIEPGPDNRAANDTLFRQFSARDGYPFTFSIFTDERPTETSFRLLNNENMVIYELPQASLGDEAGFDFHFCLSPGCYTLEINDQGGDGICCTSGNGAYYLKDPFDKIVLTGGAFSNKKLEQFCIDSTLTLKDLNGSNTMKIYPLPAKEWVGIEFGKLPGNKHIEILDLTGSLIMQTQTTDFQFSLNVSGMKPGLYLVRLSSENTRAVSRILIQY